MCRKVEIPSLSSAHISHFLYLSVLQMVHFQFFFLIHLFERFNEDPSVLDDLYLDHSKILFNTALRGKFVFSFIHSQDSKSVISSFN